MNKQNKLNRANPWAKKKAVGESMTFIQHLLENTPTSKENLLEVNSEDFLNILLAAAGEEPLQEGELKGFPKHMTVGELVTIYEGRMPPPRMNYSFDEEEEAKMQANRDRETAYEKSMRVRGNWHDPENPSKSHRNADYSSPSEKRQDQGTHRRRRSVYGTEEEEAKMQANRDRAMVSKGVRERTPTRGGVSRMQRNAQIAGRAQRNMRGKGSGGGNWRNLGRDSNDY